MGQCRGADEGDATVTRIWGLVTEQLTRAVKQQIEAMTVVDAEMVYWLAEPVDDNLLELVRDQLREQMRNAK